MIIKVDRNIYSDSCISKVIYWLSECYICTRTLDDNVENISVESRDDSSISNEVEAKFWLMLNDYKLRDIIHQETKDINVILYLKAFGELNDLLDEPSE